MGDTSQDYQLGAVDTAAGKVTLTKRKRKSGKSEAVSYSVEQLLDGAPITSS